MMPLQKWQDLHHRLKLCNWFPKVGEPMDGNFLSRNYL